MPALSPPAVARRELSLSGKSSLIAVCMVGVGGIAFLIFWGYILPRLRPVHRQRPSRTRHNSGQDEAITLPARLPPYTVPTSGSAQAQGLRFAASREPLPLYDPRTESPFENRRYTEVDGELDRPRSMYGRRPNPPARISTASSTYSRNPNDEGQPFQGSRRPTSISASAPPQVVADHTDSWFAVDRPGNEDAPTIRAQTEVVQPSLEERRMIFERMDHLGVGYTPRLPETPLSAELKTPAYMKATLPKTLWPAEGGRPDSPVLGALAYMKSAKSSETGASDEYWKDFSRIHLRGGQGSANITNCASDEYQHPRAEWYKHNMGLELESSGNAERNNTSDGAPAPDSLMPRPLKVRKVSSVQREDGVADTNGPHNIRLCPPPRFWKHGRSRSVSSMTTMYTNHENQSDYSLRLPLQSPSPTRRLSLSLDEPSVASNYTRLSRADWAREAVEADGGLPFQPTDISDDLFGDRIKRLKRVDTIAAPNRGRGVQGEEIVGRGGRVVRHGGWF